MDLSFGWRTATLLTIMLTLLPIAGALANKLVNRLANRLLALLLIVLIGIFTPWMIGFAGFYDLWPWLTFLPVAVPLFVPALIYLYIYAIVHQTIPKRWWWLFLPGAIEFSFQLGSFLLPLPIKLQWADNSTYISRPAFGCALIVSFVLATVRSLTLLGRYRLSLAQNVSDEARYATGWLKRSLIAFAVLWTFWAITLLTDLVSPIGYKGLMALYLAIASFALYLGIEGWRHADLRFPKLQSMVFEPASRAQPERDWSTQAKSWEAKIRDNNWFQEPDLSLMRTAKLLGTNGSYLSRACNDGLGENFSTMINRLRCEHVAALLISRPNDDLLGIAFDAGFASKASFNRAFRHRYGMSPSAWKARSSQML